MAVRESCFLHGDYVGEWCQPCQEVIASDARRALPRPERSSHHWGEFLRVRMDLIAAWTDEGCSVAEIMQFLSVDPGQIRLLQLTIAQRRLVAVEQKVGGG